MLFPLIEIAVLLSAAVGPAVAKEPTSADSTRHFRMGFTPFPHDQTLDAVTAVDRFIRENADVVATHFEGVPWAEARSGKPWHAKLQEEWDRQRRTRPPAADVYLALTPINLGRTGLADYRASREGLPLPEPFVGKPFDDPIVKDAYLKYCRRAVQFFRPKYLAIGIESNELFHNARPKWAAYVRLHRHVYAALKREHPALPVFASFTLHNMLNPSWQDRVEMRDAFKELMPDNDFVAISFYPFMANLSADLDRSFAWVTAEFGRFRKPYAFAESGQIAEPLVLDSLSLTLPGDPAGQKRFVEKWLSFGHEHDVRFLIWFVSRDYDGLWERIRADAPEFFKAWRDTGLLDGDGHSRLAHAVWRTHFAREFRKR